MTSEELRQLSLILERAFGFVLREDFQVRAERKIASRLEHLGMKDMKSYLLFLDGDVEERASVIELLFPQESSFFRDPKQWHSFEHEILPLLEKENASQRALRVWSAGCSRGEEPYTVAMLIASRPALAGWNVDIVGTDVSASALQMARLGEYERDAVRDVSPELKRRHFDVLEGERVRVRASIKANVRWEQLNLLDEAKVAALPQFDVIFCRNVFIYFSHATRQRVTRLAFERLRPGGYLLLGHAENSPQAPPGFELVRLKHHTVYRRELAS